MAAARAAARVSDPRPARIFDADDRVEPSFIVTGWPSDACLADLLTAGPLDPWQAARMIAEAADALAVAHQAGLAHLCLSPASLWCGPGGEVTVTGLGILAALTGAQAGDPVLADTRGLARVLYAALTGYWPGGSACPFWMSNGGRIVSRGARPPSLDGLSTVKVTFPSITFAPLPPRFINLKCPSTGVICWCISSGMFRSAIRRMPNRGRCSLMKVS